MKTIQTLCAGALAMLCACQPAQQGSKYTVTGELEDSTHHGKKIYIMRYDDNKYVDSTFIDGNKFVFDGVVDTASFCRIDVSREAFANFILEGGDVKVDLKTYVHPSGTPQNEELSRLAKEEEDFYADVKQKRREINEKYPDDKAAREEAHIQYSKTMKAELAKKITEFYANHSNDAVGYI